MGVSDFFSGVGNLAGGIAQNVYDASVFGRRQKEIEKIDSLLQSEKGRRLLMDSQKAMNEARTGALNRGEGYYGSSKTKADPRIDQISKLISAADKASMLGNEVLSKSLTAQAQLLTDEIGAEGKQKKKEDKLGFSPEGADPIDVGIRMGGGLESLPKARDYLTEAPGETKEMETSKHAADYFQAPTTDFIGPPAPTKPASVQEAHGPNVPGMPEVSQQYMEQRDNQSPANYFQAPRTYEQLGITNVDEQATLQEMQEALPDVDMRQEYEGDPENMQRLMKLWREKRISKTKLREFFLAIQQKARESLGIAR